MTNLANPSSDWTGELITPDEVLYNLDGPAIFLKTVGPINFLFFKADEQDTSDLYIVSQVRRKNVDYLKRGKLSVRGALLSGDLWAFELDLDRRVIRYQEVSESDISIFLPSPGVALRAEFGVTPDSVQQSEASYAFKFFGDELTEEGMPFSTFKNLVDDVYATLRKVLTPASLGQGKAGTALNFPIRQPEFASLVIAIDSPEIDSGRLKRGKNTKNLDADDVLAESEAMGIDFAGHFRNTVKALEGGMLPPKFAADNLDFLLAVVDILPSQRGGVKRLQFSANRDDGNDVFVELDVLAAETIRASVREIDDIEIDLFGTISGVLKKSNTLRVQTTYGREVTCQLRVEVFGELLADGKLIVGRSIILTGSFTKRQLRDLMKVEGYPTFP